MDKKKVIILGASGHGRVVADIVEGSGDKVLGFLDDREAECFPGMKILGKMADAVTLSRQDIHFVIAIGDNETRRRFAGTFASLRFYKAIHPSAIIAGDVGIGAGTVIMPHAVINTGCKIGRHCIVNTAASLDHDNEIGAFVHISPGVHTAGSVSIGSGSWLGIGAVISNNLSICGGCTIGAGAVVIRDIVEAGTYVGVPARKILWRRNAHESVDAGK